MIEVIRWNVFLSDSGIIYSIICSIIYFIIYSIIMGIIWTKLHGGSEVSQQQQTIAKLRVDAAVKLLGFRACNFPEAILLLLIEILHDFIYQNHRNYGSIVYMGHIVCCHNSKGFGTA